ncbi:hypothetical protein Dde_3132 [Oleidesulfovibrio alaskensis G20]|jgi:hypothetical protein|uniref:Uncharacterized protein n=1 Tax=Oleidesulfovibrio alaskensis (strain ATCC BAA-1058 / DSM 17464 / G20) TaxID=207559 RepID=Q30WM0_OLEA2|nr:hypothetical protein [Oleidesulfovibrio alaskensis]ABB39926.1 hypothetical protein Dde_3132 [Oleidesulfovibrio alaskensis G20]MBG0774113.1 hypothetical protein [Oleidesulfovibrio alaskensis]MBL3581546.1 hypothetical protein [Oleidesulfovibrio alaskensis]
MCQIIRTFELVRQGDMVIEDIVTAVKVSGVPRWYPFEERWRWMRLMYMQGKATPQLLRTFLSRLSAHTPYTLCTLQDLNVRSGVEIVCPVLRDTGVFDL